MDNFNASTFFQLCKISEEWKQRFTGSTVVIPEDFRTGQVEAIRAYDRIMRSMGLLASAASFRKIADALERPGSNWGEVATLSDEFLGRMIDETGEHQFFSLLPKELDFFKTPRKGWRNAIERFPTIIDDVEETSKCFALSRYPAAVFHSVQIIEAGLIELGKFLKVTDPHSGWTSVSGALQKVIDKKYSDRSRFEKTNFAFLEQMQGLIQGLKNAWRNKISHAHGRITLISKEFSAETAEEIIMATRAFMRRLAEELPPAKPKKGAKK